MYQIVDFGEEQGKARLFIIHGDEFACPVCGFSQGKEAPYCDKGGSNFDICPCCRIEYGFDDDAALEKPEKRVVVWHKLRGEWLRAIKITEEIRSQLRNIEVEIDEGGNQISDSNLYGAI